MGSLGSDLSPLGPLRSSLVSSHNFKPVLIVLWLGCQVELHVDLSKREGNRYSKEIRRHSFLPSARVFKSVCVVVIECDGVRCEGRGPLALTPRARVCGCVV